MNEAFFFAIEYDDDDDDFFLLLFARREEVVKDVRYDDDDVNDDDDKMLPPPSMRVCREREGDESDWKVKNEKKRKKFISSNRQKVEPHHQTINYIPQIFFLNHRPWIREEHEKNNAKRSRFKMGGGLGAFFFFFFWIRLLFRRFSLSSPLEE